MAQPTRATTINARAAGRSPARTPHPSTACTRRSAASHTWVVANHTAHTCTSVLDPDPPPTTSIGSSPDPPPTTSTGSSPDPLLPLVGMNYRACFPHLHAPKSAAAPRPAGFGGGGRRRKFARDTERVFFLSRGGWKRRERGENGEASAQAQSGWPCTPLFGGSAQPDFDGIFCESGYPQPR